MIFSRFHSVADHLCCTTSSLPVPTIRFFVPYLLTILRRHHFISVLALPSPPDCSPTSSYLVYPETYGCLLELPVFSPPWALSSFPSYPASYSSSTRAFSDFSSLWYLARLYFLEIYSLEYFYVVRPLFAFWRAFVGNVQDPLFDWERTGLVYLWWSTCLCFCFGIFTSFATSAFVTVRQKRFDNPTNLE